MKSNKALEKRTFVLDCLRYISAGVILIAPILDGIIYEHFFFLVSLFVSILTLIFLWITWREQEIRNINVLLILLCLSYFFSFLFSVHLRDALIGLIRQVFYVLSFYLAIGLFSEEKYTKVLYISMVAAITLSSAITFLAQANLLNLPTAISGGRFGATFHYANTYASVLVAIIPLILSLYLNSEDKVKRYIYLIILYINVTAFFATLSRGALIVYLPVMVIFYVCIPKPVKAEIISIIIPVNVLGIIAASFILKSNSVVSLLYLITGVLIITLTKSIMDRFRTQHLKSLFIYLITAFLLLVILTFGNQDILASLSRFSEINLETQNASLRIVFYMDALKIIKSNLLIGVGAGGWEALYKTIQGHLYNASQVHSSIIQFLIEVGILGSTLFLLIVLSAIFLTVKDLLHKKASLYHLAALIAIIALFSHSLIDFDLSLPAVSMYFYLLIGILSKRFKTINKPFIISPIKIITILMSIMLLLFSISFGISANIVKKSLPSLTDNKLLTEDINKLEKRLSSAVKLDPLNSANVGYLGQIKIIKASQENSTNGIHEGLQLLDYSISLEPYNYETYQTKGKLLIQLKRREEAIDSFIKIIELMPMQHTGYEYSISNYVQLGIEKKNPKFIQKAIEINELAVEQMKKVSPERLRLWEEQKLNESPTSNYNLGVAYYLLGEYEKGLLYFNIAGKYFTGEKKDDVNAWIYFGELEVYKYSKIKASKELVYNIQKYIEGNSLVINTN